VKKLMLAASIAMLSFSSTKATAQCNFINKLSYSQQEVAYQAFRLGQPHDLSLTMVAISWKESKLGAYKIRLGTSRSDQSFGVMHTVAKWKTKGMTAFERGRWAERMVFDDAYSLNVGLKDVLYWQEHAKGDWMKGVGMYNGGRKPNMKYAQEVRDIVREIKHCEF
jgi:hypothetical protein